MVGERGCKMSESKIKIVCKRDGRSVPFTQKKIADAIFKAALAVGGENRFLAEEREHHCSGPGHHELAAQIRLLPDPHPHSIAGFETHRAGGERGCGNRRGPGARQGAQEDSQDRGTKYTT